MALRRVQYLIFRWEVVEGVDDYRISFEINDEPLTEFTTADTWFQLEVEALRGDICAEVTVVAPPELVEPPSGPVCHSLNGPLAFQSPLWAVSPLELDDPDAPRALTVAWIDQGFAALHRVRLALDGRPYNEVVLGPGSSQSEFDVAGASGQLCATVTAFGAQVPESAPAEPVCVPVG